MGAVLGLYRHGALIKSFVKRDMQARYKGSAIGLFWSVVHPLVMLVLYTYIFSAILRVRVGATEGTGSFAIYLFCGLLPWNAFAEGVNRSTGVIVEFSELKEFIDQPTGTYSTGMHMRLGFSVAMHINPEIILVDEGLAVGDMGFVRTCVERLERFKKEGKTIVVVTREMNTVKHWCDQGVWLHEGRVMATGDPDEVVDAYTKLVMS